MSSYYTYRQIEILIRGEPAMMIGKPGVWSWNGLNAGTAALIDAMEIRSKDRALDLGCGTGVIGLAATRLAYKGWTMLVDVNVAAVHCAEQTLAVNGVVNAEVRLGDGTDAVEEYDLVLCHLPRGRAVVEMLIRDAALALKPGGRFYLVAHKRAGVKGAIKFASQLLGRIGVVRRRQGYHVALAVKEQSQALKVSRRRTDDFLNRDIALDGVPTTLVSRQGVFAWDRVDAGTATLIHTMAIHPGETVLDIGCGTGLLALAAARQGGRVVAVDVDLRAVESARRTLAVNGVDGEVTISDCAQAVLERRFDVVLCNPPFHQGLGVEYDVALQMVRDAANVLQPGGRFYLVSNAFIRYEREMAGRFARVEEVFNDRRYRVLCATR
jgi:16S rRNA (guanine1207-N2)-methyltransferase